MFQNRQNLEELGDELLIQMAQDGNLDAFTALYERYLPFVYKRVCCVVPETDVEDVTQEIFITLLKSIESFRGEAKFSTWLRTLVNRRVADYYRHRNPAQVEMDQDVSETAEYFGPVTGGRKKIDDSIILRHAIARLPEHYQEVILLRFAEGLKFKEIADITGQSLEATKSLFRRAIDALRSEMGDNDNDH